MNIFNCKPIGVIHSPFKESKGTPIQSIAGLGIEGTIEVFKEYEDGLTDLDGFSHIILLYHFHMSEGFSLKVIPFMDDHPRGLFSTRAPRRPNPIGISIVHLIKMEDNILHIKDLDIIDGTPLLDIKPYVPDIDVRETSKKGWLETNISKISKLKDDGRFTRPPH
jgi:tRNA-Thr(GGU) m(6)t(6)A37 methyltransferase TsaA